MQTNPPYPIFGTPPPVLDIGQTLQLLPNANPKGIICTNFPPISYLLLADRLAELYEMIFPHHPEWLDIEVDWKDNNAVTVAAEQFLNRVNTLFPVYDEIWEAELEVIEWRLWEIPVVPMGYDEWHDEWDNYKEPVPYLLHLMNSRFDSEDEGFNSFAHYDDCYPNLPMPQGLDPYELINTLRQTCAERCRTVDLPEPLDGLPDLIEMLTHSTGNLWLDVGEISLMEGGGYPSWNRENVKWLTEEWQEAKPILDRINSLLDWKHSISTANCEKVTAVHDTLLKAYQRKQADDPAKSAVTTTPT